MVEIPYLTGISLYFYILIQLLKIRFKNRTTVKNYLLIFVLLVPFSIVGQILDCKDFKNGKFRTSKEEMENSIIERSGSVQIEYGEISQLKVELEVNWIDDCHYTLTLVQVLENPKGIPINKNLIWYVTIIETKENAYTQYVSNNVNDFIDTSEMLRIE
jgi:hypothetical protein